MSEPVTILIRLPNWLGDCVMALPSVRHLADALPRAAVYLAGRPQFRDLFAAQPGVAGFVDAPGSGVGNLIRGLGDARCVLRDAGIADRPDLGLLLTNSLSTAAWMWRTGARRRVGYNRDCRRLFLTHPVPCGGMESSWHFIRYYLWLAKIAESVLAEEEETNPRQIESLAEYLTPTLTVGADGNTEAKTLLSELGVPDRYAVFAPASAYGEVKDWPAAHYRELVERVNREWGFPVLVTGGGGQAPVCQAIADGQQAAHSIAGRTSIAGFAGLLAGASLFVGGDSGGAHVAAALGIPTVVIFGITNPTRTRPTGRAVVMIGAGRDTDVKLSTAAAREAAREALAGIAPDQVTAALREFAL